MHAWVHEEVAQLSAVVVTLHPMQLSTPFDMGPGKSFLKKRGIYCCRCCMWSCKTSRSAWRSIINCVLQRMQWLMYEVVSGPRGILIESTF